MSDETSRSEANLRRATSDLYYSLFHAICEAILEPFATASDSPELVEAYTRLYRQPEHGAIEKRCRSIARSDLFTPDLRRFAKHVVTMKNKRELADYHPLEKFMISVVRNDVETTETRLKNFWESDPKDRATFAFIVGVDGRGGL